MGLLPTILNIKCNFIIININIIDIPYLKPTRQGAQYSSTRGIPVLSNSRKDSTQLVTQFKLV